MKKPGRKLQKRTMGLLRNLMILGVSFVGLTVVLQLEIEYNLLVLIYALSAVAVLLYQLIRNRSDRDKLDQEVARSNFLMNAALPGGDVRLFELLPDGMIRVLSPGKGQGGQLKTTLETPRRLLSYLNCSAQWEAPFLAALEQAALGQDSEVEFQTMDQEETWIQLRMEPLPDNEETTAIGHHPGRDPEGQGAPPPGGGLQAPHPDDGQHHGRAGNRPGGGHLAAALGNPDLPGPASAGRGARSVQRVYPRLHRPHHPSPGPGAVLPVHGTLGPAVHLPGGPSPGPSGVPGKGGPGPGL